MTAGLDCERERRERFAKDAEEFIVLSRISRSFASFAFIAGAYP